MSVFTSPRERRLWRWVGALLAVIYSTLGLTARVAGVLRAHNLLRVAVALLFASFAGAVVHRLWARRAGQREWGVLLAFAFVCAWAAARIPLPEERTHLIEYGCVASLLYMALSERIANGRTVRGGPWLVTVVATASLGCLDEGIQALLPHRVFDPVDIGFNALAGLMFGTGMAAAARARRWDAGRRAPPP